MPATTTANNRKIMRLLFMSLFPGSSCHERSDDPQAAGRNGRAVGQATPQGGGTRDLPRRTNGDSRQEGETQKAPDKSRNREEVELVGWTGKQAGGSQQLHIAATDGTKGEGKS